MPERLQTQHRPLGFTEDINWMSPWWCQLILEFSEVRSSPDQPLPQKAEQSQKIRILCLISRQNSNSKDTCILMFITELLTIAQTWKQPKCPLTYEWLKELWYTYTMECYLAIKKEWNNAICSNNLEIIILSEVTHIEKKNHMILLIRGIFKKKKKVQMNLYAKPK